jgi:hypothetical protein
MPNGKAAGQRCVNLEEGTDACRIWGTDAYPEFCRGFQPERAFCGDSREQAQQILSFLESDTAP